MVVQPSRLRFDHPWTPGNQTTLPSRAVRQPRAQGRRCPSMPNYLTWRNRPGGFDVGCTHFKTPILSSACRRAGNLGRVVGSRLAPPATPDRLAPGRELGALPPTRIVPVQVVHLRTPKAGSLRSVPVRLTVPFAREEKRVRNRYKFTRS